MVKQRYIHPFPARMAPEIAIDALEGLRKGDVVLDPMSGSGTVLHQASLKGLESIGFDLDPLAVLMTRISTRKINIKKVEKLHNEIITKAKSLNLSEIKLPWIDNDKETKEFIKYWFAKAQIRELRKLAFSIYVYKKNNKNSIEIDVLRLALSRIIITKKIGASLAWDISHSRPHRMRQDNDFKVFHNFTISVRSLSVYLTQQNSICIKGKILRRDARNLKLPTNSVDSVITSPPYLNAIDYMRGHKFSLIWLGYPIERLRKIRSVSVGVEKTISSGINLDLTNKIHRLIVDSNKLSRKHEGMIKRYVNDSIALMSEIARVLKKNKKATLVVGDSTLNGYYIKNSRVFTEAGKLFGLSLKGVRKREIPIGKRYLPLPKKSGNSLSKRMKYEMILTFLNEKS